MKSTLLFLLVFLCTVPFAHADTPTLERPIAVLRALDKVTGRVAVIEVGIERPFKFGTVFITVHSCRVTTPEEAPESAVFLDVFELTSAKRKTAAFSGWMFASSPALSAMEHPVYDLWLIGCRQSKKKTVEEQ